MLNRPWTVREVGLVRQWFAEGVPDATIGARLGRSKNAVKCVRWKSGIVGDYRARRLTDEVREQMRRKPTGPASPMWKGGRRLTAQGYVEVFRPDHPRARGNGYVFEHILVMESKIGRALEPDEVVHHVDRNRTNNHPDNLQLLKKGAHSQIHKRAREGVTLTCPVCGKQFYSSRAHAAKRTTCGFKCAGVLFRQYYLGKPRDYRPTEAEKREAIKAC